MLENYTNNIIGSAEQVSRILQEVDHPGLELVMDPTNDFDDGNIDKVDTVIKQMFWALGDKIKIAHAKDCK